MRTRSLLAVPLLVLALAGCGSVSPMVGGDGQRACNGCPALKAEPLTVWTEVPDTDKGGSGSSFFREVRVGDRTCVEYEREYNQVSGWTSTIVCDPTVPAGTPPPTPR